MKLFIKSSKQFLKSETDLIMSGVSERCLCGAFMLIIRKYLDEFNFKNYYSDIEYNRNFDRQIKTIIDDNSQIINITCDLIIHSRGQIPKLDNLIAIEMKRDNSPETEKNRDRVRLKALTKLTNYTNTYSVDGRELPKHVCGYLLGVFYEISLNNRNIKIEYYSEGKLYKEYLRKF